MTVRLQKPFSAYRGEDPYFFVCYAHDDAAFVYPELERLRAMGANLWYDEGIEPGSEWSEALALAIASATTLLLFVSPRSVRSKHCRDEISYAKERGVTIVSIYLEATTLTEGLKLSLGSSQAIMKFEMTDALYEQKLRNLLAAQNPNTATASASVPQPRSRRSTWLAAAAATAFGVLAVGALQLSGNDSTPAPAASEIHPSEDGRTSIAVLPFVNLSDDQDNEFFADGLTDTLIYQLSRLETLRVIARTSAFAFKGSTEGVNAIAAQLGVGTVLDGSVQRHGDRIRVIAQLTDIASNNTVWSDRFDAKVEDTFVIQDEIATSVTRALKLKLLGTSADSLTVRTTENLEAYEQYLRGMQFYEKFDFASLQRSEALLQNATELDPSFSVAYLALVRNLTTQFMAGSMGAEELKHRTDPLMARVAELGDGLPEESALRGLLESFWGNSREGRKMLQYAVERSPNNATALAQLGGLTAFSDSPAQGLELTLAARALDPLGQWPKFDTWFAAQRLGQFQQAWSTIEAAQQVWDRFFQGMQLYLANGDYPGAIDAFSAGSRDDPLDPEFPVYLAFIELDLGDTKLAQRHATRAFELDPNHKMSITAAALLKLDGGNRSQAAELAAGALRHPRPFRFEATFILPRLVRDDYLERGEPEAARDMYLEFFPQLRDRDLEGGYPVIFPISMVHVGLDYSLVLDQLGEHQQAREMREAAARMLDTLPEAGLFGTALARAELHALGGDTTAALDAMRGKLDSGWSQLWKVHTLFNRNLEVLWDEPRYQQMISELRERMEKLNRVTAAAETE